MKTRNIEAMEVPVNGVFLWQNRLYAVIEDNHDSSDEMKVRCIASFWTKNPYDRWQYLVQEPERFNAYCTVEELI